MKNIFRSIALCAILGSYVQLAQAQVKIGDNPTVINKASILELESSTKGLLFPRVKLINTTTWSLSSGSTPVAGMVVYNIKTTASGFSGTTAYPTISGDGTGLYYWDGTGWVAGKGASGADGKSITGAAGAPGATTPGGEGDIYINTINGDTYIKQGNTWVLNGNIKGAKGDPGVVGVQGIPGTSGTPGTPGSGTPGAPGAGVTIVTNDSGTWVYDPTTNTWTNINGPKGDKGDKGDAGVVGVQGMAGTNGIPGTPGSGTPGAPGAGVTIVTNDSGTWVYNPTTNTWTNINGPKGDKGDKGDAGVVGVQGMAGTNGIPGTPGSGTPGAPGTGVTIVTNDSGTWVYNPTTNTWTNINGPKGDKGDKGDAGVVGVQGMPGTSGTPGTPGSGTPGAPGAGVTIVTNDSGTWVYNPTTNTWTNINGPKGDKGDKGDAGVVGVQGMAGTNGIPGTPGSGTPGAPGAGITIVTNDSGTWVYNPATNTWTNINGPKGDKGDKGDAGVVGVQGMPGTSGTPGTPGSGTPGAPGAGITIVTNDSGTWVYNPATNTWTNINGPKGDKGDAGVVGVQGMPGTSGTPGTPGSGTPGAPGAGITIVTNDSGTWVYNPATNTWTNINGPKGDKGDAGVVGVQGMAGTNGIPGTPGSGTPGAPGAGITIVTNDSGTWVYNPTTNTWTNINGPKGDKGDAGTFVATVDNGLNFSTPTNIQLGGTLIKPTTITTDPTQTLAIAGLQSGMATDNLVVTDPTTGVLRSVSPSIFKADLRVVGTDNHVTQDAGVSGNGTSLGSGSGNLAIGKGILANISSGNRNIGIGTEVMNNLTSGTENIVLGRGSAFDLSTGNQNIVIGSNSGGLLTDQSNNIIIGNSISGAPSGAVISNLVNINNNIYSTSTIGNGFGRTALGAFFYNSITDNVFKETLNIGSGGVWIKDINAAAYAGNAATDKLVVADATGVLKTVPSASLNATNWQITGNVGTTAANFLGTTDDVPLNFKIDNTVAGNVSKTGTSFGYKANTGTGDHNTAFGLEALSLVTTGLNNTAMGAQALRVSTGSANTAFGNEALVSNTTGGANVAVGNYAMRMNTTGTGNAVLGNSAMSQNTQGALNVAVGGNTLFRNTSGTNNVAIGTGSLESNTTGYRNVAIGGSADVSVDNLTNAIAIGFNSKVGASNSLALGGTDFYQVNVGINTPTPSNKLHIVGNGTVDPVRIEGLQTGAATDKIVVADASGVLKTVSSLSATNIKKITAAYTVLPTDYTILANATGTGFTVTLPAASASEGRILVIRKTDETTNLLTFSAPIKISETTSFTTLNINTTIRIQSDGTDWYKID